MPGQPHKRSLCADDTRCYEVQSRVQGVLVRPTLHLMFLCIRLLLFRAGQREKFLLNELSACRTEMQSMEVNFQHRHASEMTRLRTTLIEEGEAYNNEALDYLGLEFSRLRWGHARWFRCMLLCRSMQYSIYYIPFGQLVLKLGIWSGTSSPWLPTRTQKRNAQVTQGVLGTVMGDTFAKSKTDSWHRNPTIYYINT